MQFVQNRIILSFIMRSLRARTIERSAFSGATRSLFMAKPAEPIGVGPDTSMEISPAASFIRTSFALGTSRHIVEDLTNNLVVH